MKDLGLSYLLLLNRCYQKNKKPFFFFHSILFFSTGLCFMNEQDIKAGILKYPETTLEFANLVHVQRWAGLSRFAIQDDIQYLLLHFFSVGLYMFYNYCY